MSESRMPFIIPAILLFLMALSCAEIESVDYTEELCIDLMLPDNTKSPLYDRYLPDGASIGVTLLEYGKDTYDGVRYHNVRFTASGTGENQIWIPERPIVLTETKGYVYAYYPYTSEYSGHAVPVCDDDTDNMYGVSYEEISRDNKIARLYFYHNKFITRVKVERGSYSGEGHISNIYISTLGTWGYAEAKVINYTSYVHGTQIYSSAKLYPGPFDLDYAPVLESMWIPDLIPGGNPLDIAVEIDGHSYFARTSDFVWDRGDIYDFTFIINEM